MAKKDDLINGIRLGDGEWNFSTFFPRPEEDSEKKQRKDEQPQKSKLNLEDRFTQSFLSLHQALKRNQEEKENQKALPYYLLHAEEQRGIFLLKGNTVSLTKVPFHLTGAEATEEQRRYMYSYARELRKYLEQLVSIRFKPLNQYLGSAAICDNENNKYAKVNMAVSINLEQLFHATLFPLEEKNTLGRVVYQLTYPDKEKVLGAGFFYLSKENTYGRYEVKKLSLKE